MSEPLRSQSSTASGVASPGAGSGVPSDSNSVGDLVGQVAHDLSTLIRQEVDLAKAEATAEAKKAARAAGLFGGAGLAAWLLAVFATVTAMAALDIAIPLWAAALIVAFIWGLAAAVFAMRGRTEMRQVRGLPETKESLKEDAEWARHPIT